MAHAHERVQRQILVTGSGWWDRNAPDAIAAVAASLLHHQLARPREPTWESLRKVFSGAKEVRVGSPAEGARVVQNFFGTHLADHVGMGRDPGAATCRFAEQ